MSFGIVEPFLARKGEVCKHFSFLNGGSAKAAMFVRISSPAISIGVLLVLLALFVGPSQSYAQSNSPDVAQLASTNPQEPQGKRDPAAINLVERSLAVLGGKASIAAVQSMESSGTITGEGPSGNASFRWTVLISGSDFEFRKETNDGKTIRVFASGHGHPGYMSGGTKAKPLHLQMATAAPPYELPAVLLYAELMNPALSFTMESSTSAKLSHIQITNKSNPLIEEMYTQDWYFDSLTNMPVRVEYHLPTSTDASVTVPAYMNFLDYKSLNHVQYPTSLEIYENGAKVGQVTILSMKVNTSPDSSAVDIPLEKVHTAGARQ